MQAEKLKIIETLTGIRSSKKNYYVELQQKIEEVTLRNKQLEIINRIARSFNVDLPIERIIKCLIDKLTSVISLDEFNLSILDDGDCKSINGKPGCEAIKVSTCSPSCTPNSVCRYIIKNKTSLTLPDEAEAAGIEVNSHMCPGSAVFVPLMAKDRVIGIFSIKSKLEGAYSAQDLTFLTQLAQHLSNGLNNMRLFSEVLQRETEWEDTFRAITDAIIIVDDKYKIVRNNNMAAELFNFKTKDTKTKKCYEIIHQKSEPCDTCPMIRGNSGNKSSYRFQEGPNNQVYDVYAYPMFGRKRKLMGVVEAFKDVTNQVACEMQLIQSEKLAAIGKLGAGVAHELNSPLTAILGNAQLLLREFPVEDENHVLIEDIKQCGIRCKNIILNLLSFARQQQLETESILINEVIEKAIRLVGHQIRQERIKLKYHAEPDLPEIHGSSQQLEQVIINLLINAKDALDQEYDDRKILVSTGRCSKETQDYIFISVKDNGCGMNQGQLTEIFTPFYTTKDVGKGTGLGLAVSMGIVQNHGGFIECDSSPGNGSNFTILLPIK